MTKSLADRISRLLLEKIGQGAYGIGDELPSEGQLAEEYDVSRLTIRESIKALASRGVIEVRHGKRNRVAPAEQWDLLDADLMKLRGSLRGESQNLIEQLTEVRHILEIGAAELAAQRISSQQLALMREQLEIMIAAESVESEPDIPRAVEADISFHRIIIDAASNEYLSATYRPLEEVLQAVRLKTSATRKVRREAIAWHTEILNRLEQRDTEGSREAMRSHMTQTLGAVREETS
ncbi:MULTISPECIES: FadR/GntR family transcriptional regulator [Kocuria]|uniref:FadR/GntR family transcriptional regulator n=1 Tax=Kocuria TaxID=57493 RepID=UPI0006615D28|nr:MULTISPECIES: FadR/GntR family transcriptional regulator [Kocuria]RUQ22688.1 FadR family transcriptional regulator [Kocuria sp. HSID16901]